MSDSSQKTQLGWTTHKAIEVRAQSNDHNLGKALPGSIAKINANQTAITINFETDGKIYTMPKVVLPLGISRYFRIPYAVGDKGYVLPGALSVTPSDSLGPNIASFTELANLSALVFHPMADVQAFPAMDDPQAVQHNAPNGTISRDDQKISLVKTNPTTGASISSGGNSTSPGPQNFQALPGGNTVHEASTNHDSTVGGTHTITAGVAHIINAVTNVTKMLSAAGGLSIPAGQSLSVPSGSVPAAALASGAASANVGTVGGDLAGDLPDPTVTGITHINNANTLPIYASDAAALAGGLVAGQLYINDTVSGTEHVLCVVF